MKKYTKILLILFILFFQMTSAGMDEKIELSISGAVQNTQMPLALIILDQNDKKIEEIIRVLKNDLAFTGQFDITTKIFKKNYSKKQLKEELDNQFLMGVSLAICINTNSKSIEWRIYDTMQYQMIAGKKYKKNGTIVRGWAHAIADDIWKELTGNNGFFSSRIAYCKEFLTKNGKILRNIYVTDFDGSHEELLVDVPTVVVFPRWNTDIKNPLLFYSEYTNTNVRLMAIDFKKNRKIVSNLDGIAMLPAFSPSNQSVVFSASRGDGYCQLYYYKDGELRCVNKNDGNNVSPVFVDEENIYFCSDSKNDRPQIYLTNLKTGHTEMITKDGYCTSPSYSQKQNKLAYCKMVHGISQLFIYDCGTKKHVQLTKTEGNKYECSWSPDGTQLIHYVVSKDASRIAVFNILTRETRFITNKTDRCSYPSWSPCYSLFPTVG